MSAYPTVMPEFYAKFDYTNEARREHAAKLARKILEVDFPGFENRLEFEVYNGNIAGLCYLLETNRVKLQQLRLTETGWDDPRMLYDALKSNTTLTALDFYCNKLGPEGAEAVALGMKTNHTLTILNIRDNDLDDVGVKLLAENLKGNTTLTQMDFSRDCLRKNGSVFISALAECTNLTALVLHNDFIDDEGGKALGEVLKHLPKLKELDLGYNLIGEEGGKAIAEGLQSTTSLKFFVLSHNKLGPQAGKAFGEAIKKNQSLTRLCLEENTFGNPGAIGILEGLRENTKLVKLDISDNEIVIDEEVMNAFFATFPEHNVNLAVFTFFLGNYIKGFKNRLFGRRKMVKAWEARACTAPMSLLI